MKLYKKETRVQEFSTCIGRSCDLCHVESKTGDWHSTQYNEDDTEISIRIKHRQGHNYGYDGGDGDEIEIDLCPKCFRERLVVWLKSQGAAIDYVDWSW